MNTVFSNPSRASSTDQPIPLWAVPDEELFAFLASGPGGLSSAEARKRLAGVQAQSRHPGRWAGDLHLLIRQFRNPIILILFFASLVSLVVGDVPDTSIILAIVAASGGLSFWQERSAGRAVAELLARVAVEVEVVRDGQLITVPLETIVPGDVVSLAAGRIIAGDGRILESQNLLVDESPLTGESFPIEKAAGVVSQGTAPRARNNVVFMGSHVRSGQGSAIVFATGDQTEFGRISAALETATETSFERGITSFGYLLARATTVLVATIFAANLLLDRPFIDSLLFSLALAVGLTPQLMPAIISVTLSAGARQMAREQVIVKRLNAIEDFGSMTVLCMDKTGSLTEGLVAFGGALDPDGQVSESVRRLAWLNAHFQRGYANPIDAAILVSDPVCTDAIASLGEVPYDFDRKRLSVLVADRSGPTLISKGALEPLLAICSEIEASGGPVPLTRERRDMELNIFRRLSNEGYRVLGVAQRSLPAAVTLSAASEQDLAFAGFLLFADPPKAGAAAEIAELASLGISVRMITGDNRLAAAHAGAAVGLSPKHLLTGGELDTLSEAALHAAVQEAMIFAEVEPVQKQRIVQAIQSSGAVVGYLGDGINDAPALRVADVGITVDTAVDVARATAAIVLLAKELSVIADGVRLGRVTFANTLKYITVTTSANFGNMLSMAAAAVFLPFLPMLPRQILLLNFLSDIPGMTIAKDNVDPERVSRPQTWDIGSIRSLMLLFGAVSSTFDMVTFAVLRLGFDANAMLFRSGWFVESVMTELAVMLVLRTRRPVFRSRPGNALLVSSALLAALTLALPYSPLAGPLGLTSIPAPVLFALGGITGAYVAATELAKKLRYRS